MTDNAFLSVSVGHGKTTDLTGKRIGRLLVLGIVGRQKRNVVWRCRCDCGSVTDKTGSALASALRRASATASCGCVHGLSLAPGEAAFNALVVAWKWNARKCNREFLLPVGRVRELSKGDCHYCGMAPSQIYRRSDFTGGYTYNGIDRIDNEVGYVEGNVVSCCGICNHMKHTLGRDEFVAHVQRIARFMEAK